MPIITVHNKEKPFSATSVIPRRLLQCVHCPFMAGDQPEIRNHFKYAHNIQVPEQNNTNNMYQNRQKNVPIKRKRKESYSVPYNEQNNM